MPHIEPDCDDKSIHKVSAPTVRETIDRIERQLESSGERTINCRTALDRLENDVELFQDLLGFYFSDSPELISAIHASVAGGNADGLHRAAHRLKGLLSNFDARGAVDAATRLESIGRSGNLAGATEACAVLDREVERVTLLLQQFCPPAQT